jgi:chemotaxis signal transduction protein
MWRCPVSESGVSAAQLRHEFDEAFARPIERHVQAREDLLLIRADGQELVLRTAEIAGILQCPPPTSLPSTHSSLRGLVGVRGTLVAVYGIATLLGGSAPTKGSGWIVLCREDRSAALLFDELVGHASVPREAIHAALVSDGAGELVEIDGVHRAVLSVPALLARIRGTTGGER